MKQSGEKYTKYTEYLQTCVFTGIALMYFYQKKCIMHYKSTRTIQKVHLAPEHFPYSCNILNK